MKLLSSLILALGLGFASTTQASVQPSVCTLTNIYVKSVSMVLFTNGSGEGVIRCNGLEPKRVSISLEAIGLGLGKFEFWGADVALGITNPYDLNGKYVAVNGSAGWGVAVGAEIGLRGDNGLSLKMGIRGGKGLGAGVNIGSWFFNVME